MLVESIALAISTGSNNNNHNVTATTGIENGNVNCGNAVSNNSSSHPVCINCLQDNHHCRWFPSLGKSMGKVTMMQRKIMINPKGCYYCQW